MKPSSRSYQEIPLTIVGGNKYGRYEKMSSEETWNMMVSDGWLVNFAGYKSVLSIDPNGQGRGIYSSSKLNKMFVVINNDVFMIDTNLIKTRIGGIATYTGDVFIAENNTGQIAFSDSNKLYIYDSNFPTSFVDAGVDFIPGYLSFQNGRFVSPASVGGVSNLWRLSNVGNGSIGNWPSTAAYVGELNTKPDKTVAAIRFPGRGNLLLVFGRTVAEQWTDAGAPIFPYIRSTSVNMDFGCLNPATIADMDNIVCWLGANEKSGPVIMYSTGGDINHISTDGIDFRLANLTQPTNCYGMMFKQDGHVIYIVTFPADNVSFMYDFNTQMFFTLSDENTNAFIAKKVVFFNNTYYFVSIIDGNLYEFSAKYTNYDYGNDVVREIPRIRIVPSIRLPDQSRFVAGYTGFTIEQGNDQFDDRDTTFAIMSEDYNNITSENYVNIGGGYNWAVNVPRVELLLSKDGGVNYGSSISREMNSPGRRQNRLAWWRLGQANDLVQQFRFYGLNRFVCTNGLTGIHL